MLVTLLLQCLTGNRIRHVKCDEEKPACYMCRKTGRICDGYTNNGDKSQVNVQSLLYGKICGQPSTAMNGLHFEFLKSEEDRHCYAYFQCNTKHQIYYTFWDSTQAHQLILQASHSSPSVRHIVIALGSLDKHLSEVKVLSQDVSPNKGRLQYANAQYVKAISQLRRDMSAAKKPSIELVLTSCLLLSLFDFLRGEDAHARTHLAAGIDILRRFYPSELSALTDDMTPSCQQPNLFVQDFARIFSVMDLYAAIWLGNSSFCSPPLLSHVSRRPPPLGLGVKPSLDDISTSLSYQIRVAHCFHHANTPIQPSSGAFRIPFHILAEKQRLLFELQQWPSSLDQCLSMMPPLTYDQSSQVALMRMNYFSILIALSTFLDPPSSSLYQSYTPTFSHIIEDARSILESSCSASSRDNLLRVVAINSQEPDPNNISVFAFVTGVIQPLYLTATKCQDLLICEEAITMLEEQPWREGAWDSATMARLARRELERRHQAG